MSDEKECAPPNFLKIAPGATLAEIERDAIFWALKQCFQNKTAAAHMLGISIRTIRNKLNQYKNQEQS